MKERDGETDLTQELEPTVPAPQAGRSGKPSRRVQLKRGIETLSYEASAQILSTSSSEPLQFRVARAIQARNRQLAQPRDITDVAVRGVQGPAQRLPHLKPIQHSFGHHDVSNVEAHVGGAAKQWCWSCAPSARLSTRCVTPTSTASRSGSIAWTASVGSAEQMPIATSLAIRASTAIATPTSARCSTNVAGTSETVFSSGRRVW